MSKTKTAANAFIDLVTPKKPKTPPLSAAKEVETLNPFQVAQQNAQRNAALPIEQGGLGLPPNNTAEDRLSAQNYYDYLHGTQRLDRLLEGEGLDPKRATSGPMPYGTDKPELASRYATGKADTSINDTGKMSDYFQVAPKDLGVRGKNLISVEQSWYHLSPEQQKQILSGYYRTGYANPEEASGAFTLHPEGTQASIASKSHLDHVLKEERGNPLAALRNLWGESGELYDNPEDLSQIFKVAGYPYNISQTNAPWTTAQGVMLGKARMDNPLLTSDTDNLVNNVIPSLREQFKGDRTRLKVGADQWAKESRYTPNQWLEELEKDVLAGKNSFVWTSIPDKVTGALKKLGHDGIIDLGGKTGGEGHQVVIPFDPTQVRSKFAAFDPMEKSSADLLKAHGGAVHKADGGMVDSVPEEAIKNTVRDPQAARLLDLDLAKYALMNQNMQPQRMAQGGQVLAEAIGGQVQTPVQGDMSKMSFEDYRKSIGMHEGGRHMAEGGQVQRFDEGGEVSQDQMRYELDRANSPVMQATPRSPIQDFIGMAGGYMDKAGKFVSEAIAPTAEKHPVKHFLANMLLADSLKGAGTLMQDLTGTVRETDEDNPVRGVISKDWKNLTTSREPMLDPRALDLAGFVTPVVKGITKLGQAGVKAVTPFAKSTAEMAAELYGSGKMPGMVAPNAYMAEPSAPKPERVLAPANEQGFYSPVEAAALNLQRKTGNGQAFLNDLLKQENVRPDEINAMGLDTFLKDKKNVTASEVQDHIAQNKLGLGESVYGGKIKEDPIGIAKRKEIFDSYEPAIQRAYKDLDSTYDRAEQQKIYDRLDAIHGERDEMADAAYKLPESKDSKFSKYQLPGGENYREVVLTLPNKPMDIGDAAKNYYKNFVQRGGEPNWSELPEVKQQEIISSMPKEAKDISSSPEYRSSHWDEPNVLAHLRMSDRVTDGKKTLLVDEVQSDWHQAGRDRGYADSNKVTAYDDYAKNLEQRVFEKIQKDFIDAGVDSERASELAKKLTAKVKGTNENLDSMHRLASQLDEESKLKELWDAKTAQDRAVPNAPYKEDWYQLALRRAVKEAIDGGYDRVALPTGQRVADRFDLSNHVDSMIYAKEADGTYSLSASKGGREVVEKSNLSESELSAFVGKDMAKKIIGNEGKSIGMNEREFTGIDLNVGGEGMRKWYDEIYPGYLKKFGKKYGASIGKTTVDADGVAEPLHYMDITPAMRKEFSTGIHMAKGGKVSFAKSADDMRKELLRNKHG